LVHLAFARVQPHLIRTFKLATDPAFAVTVRDIVGLYGEWCTNTTTAPLPSRLTVL
jgi:hypothetical protein